ncbi:diaminopimelate epimerase [Petrocella sp. FN5]|uniref:diaminopimelate epimerase n=1 Tax=Petrocella sp. FN5 TaxID=3032002 RepID=UPI0023DB7EE5|nr:diaminopimelate epimerase [Petrocella sp. FN5]MDF1618082.1 diaminopimelate epimerase [Petrocella sp. FN5]
MKFTKMHGCGNDYVYINGFIENVEDPKSLSIKMSNRHFGVGSDGIVLILPSITSDFKMRMFNADGSEAEMCGNAIRCVGKYVYDNKMTESKEVTIETLAGVKKLELKVENGYVTYAKVDMGEPILSAKEIPVVSDLEPVVGEMVVVDHQAYAMTCVSMGNPHAVVFVDEITDSHVHELGPKLEVHETFPQKINVEFVRVKDENNIEMRVWERGSGETLACGTGACATLVAAVLNGKTNRKATVDLLGGQLIIEWDKETNHVFMSGPAVTVFEGIW